jgi:hypothetical protein
MPTPGKHYEGQGGIPTPNGTPEDTACRVFRVPASDEWLGVLMGAVEQLSHAWRWYEWGSMSADDAADAWAAIIDQAYTDSMGANCAAAAVVEAPYWDDANADDAPATSDPDTEPWYDELAWVVVEGFLASIITPGGAVVFVTTVRKLRLEYQKHSAGGMFKVMVDGVEAAEVDTYAPSDELAYVDVIIPA